MIGMLDQQRSPVSPRQCETDNLARVISLLGGTEELRAVTTLEQAHDAIVSGLPTRSLQRLLRRVETIPIPSVVSVMGISAHALARRKSAPTGVLSANESSGLWRFAQSLAQATAVFGTQNAAEQWLVTPARALNNRRPIELMRSPPGAMLVADLLTRLEHGVYT